MVKKFVLCDPIRGQKLLDLLPAKDLKYARTVAAALLILSACVGEAIEDGIPAEHKEEFEDIPPDQRWGAALLLCYQLEMTHEEGDSMFEIGMAYITAMAEMQ